uniref:Peptidase S1 domain-containing protein n=1 Tax=Sinocyclocheilus grahami TaxID=75366 RepID=A0A672ST23_SINGR
KMWRLMCVTLALLAFFAHGPIYPRVAGGVNAPQGAWPWMVSVHKLNNHICGGSLITNEWVLSAAHCFIGLGPYYLRVYMGMWTQALVQPEEIMRNVRAIYTHKSYDYNTDNNDIALLWLSSPVSVNLHIKQIKTSVPNITYIDDHFVCLCPENLPFPGILQEANVFVVDNVQCHEKLKNLRTYTRITDNMLCAGVPAGGVDTACGDSGGPLLTTDGCSQWVQSGITSSGYGCAQPNTPAVYTRVSQYQTWITDLIRIHPNQNLPQFVTLSFPCSSGSRSKIISHTDTAIHIYTSLTTY